MRAAERNCLSRFDNSIRTGTLLPNWNMRGLALNAAGRRLSESSAAREGKPHVRFDVAGDENQNKVMAFAIADIPGVIP